MNPKYGFSVGPSITLDTIHLNQSVIGENGDGSTITIHAGDAVTVIGSYGNGYLQPATSSSKIFGVANGDYILTTDNKTVAQVKPQFIPVNSTIEFYARGNAVFTEAMVGSFFNLTGATGAQLIDVSSASTSTGQFVLVGLIDANNVQTPAVGSAVNTTTDSVYGNTIFTSTPAVNLLQDPYIARFKIVTYA